MEDNNAQMIKYIDHIAHSLRIQAAAMLTVEGDPNWDMHDQYVYMAETIEDSAAYFRRNDPELPEARKCPDPAYYYPNGQLVLDRLAERRKTNG